MSSYKTIEACRICGSSDISTLFDLGEMALTGVFPAGGIDVPKGPLRIVKCSESTGGCGLVQLKDSYDPSAMYGSTYGYRSGLNQSMVRHLRQKAQSIRARLGGIRGIVLDIGSNDATFLKALEGPEAELIGIDPSGAKFFSFYTPGIRLIPDFFSARKFAEAAGNRKATVVTCLSMFYDLERPVEFAREVASILSDDGIWVFEQSYLPAMLEYNSYDTVCHEHLEYYALAQILYILKHADMKILDVEINDVNGGSFSITAAHARSSHPECSAKIEEILASETRQGIPDASAWVSFRDRIEVQSASLMRFLESEKAAGRLVLGYGASTKGNVLLQHCGITSDLLPAIAEVNTEKFGAYTPGTRIPIISEADARLRKPAYFLVMPWHFRANIVERESNFLRQGGRLVFPLPVFDIVDAKNYSIAAAASRTGK